MALVVKNLLASAGEVRDRSSILGSWEDPLEGGAWQPTSISLPREPVDRGAWRVTVHGVTKSWTRLKQLSTAWPK